MILENHVSTSAEQSRSDRSSTPAHTPGPWHLKLARKYSGYWAAGDAHAVTAEDRGDNWRGYVTGVLANSPNAEANARLIAAAPELLGALEQIAIVCTDNMDADKNHRMALDFVRQVANNAIAKATGA
jgi:hypothetical protein